MFSKNLRCSSTNVRVVYRLRGSWNKKNLHWRTGLINRWNHLHFPLIFHTKICFWSNAIRKLLLGGESPTLELYHVRIMSRLPISLVWKNKTHNLWRPVCNLSQRHLIANNHGPRSCPAYGKCVLNAGHLTEMCKANKEIRKSKSPLCVCSVRTVDKDYIRNREDGENTQLARENPGRRSLYKDGVQCNDTVKWLKELDHTWRHLNPKELLPKEATDQSGH